MEYTYNYTNKEDSTKKVEVKFINDQLIFTSEFYTELMNLNPRKSNEPLNFSSEKQVKEYLETKGYEVTYEDMIVVETVEASPNFFHFSTMKEALKFYIYFNMTQQVSCVVKDQDDYILPKVTLSDFLYKILKEGNIPN